jgi:hypothetical protein
MEFSKRLAERLAFCLQEQACSPFSLAKAKKTELGYKHAGGCYGIVGCKDKTVLRVSRDYIVFHGTIVTLMQVKSHPGFAVPSDELRQLLSAWQHNPCVSCCYTPETTTSVKTRLGVRMEE